MKLYCASVEISFGNAWTPSLSPNRAGLSPLMVSLTLEKLYIYSPNTLVKPAICHILLRPPNYVDCIKIKDKLIVVPPWQALPVRCRTGSPLTSTWPHLRCDVGLKEGEYKWKLFLCYSIVYYYNGAQRYEQFLQVGWLYWALILLGLALCLPSACAEDSSVLTVLYRY